MSQKLFTYVIVLRNESSRYVNIIGFLLTIGSAVLFTYEMITMNSVVIPYLLGTLFIAGLLLWNLYVYYKLEREIFYSKALLIAGIVWMKMPYFQWLIFVLPLLALLEYQAKLSPEIGFSDDQVVFNRLFRRKHSWAEIEDVILKDGLITINFLNNRYFQREIDSGENEATEQEFNEWCRGRIVSRQ